MLKLLLGLKKLNTKNASLDRDGIAILIKLKDNVINSGLTISNLVDLTPRI